MRRTSESTLVEKDDAGFQSLEIAVAKAEESTENGYESEAQRLLLAELAAIRLWSRRARLQWSTARCLWEQQVVGR